MNLNRDHNGEGESLGPPPPPFRIGRRRVDASSFGDYQKYVYFGVGLIVLYVVLDNVRQIYVDWLWFDSIAYKSVYSKVLTARLALFFSGGLVFASCFGINCYIALRALLRSPGPGLAEAEAASVRRLYLLALIAGTVFFGFIFGSIAAGRWNTVLLFLNSESFGIEDPQFGRDVGFYVFTLPALRFVYGWVMGMLVLTTVTVAGLYVLRYLITGIDEAQRQIKAHLFLLVAGIALLFVARYWLARFDLNFSDSGVTFGAGYTDTNARLPMLYIGMALAALTSLSLVVSVFRRNVLMPAWFMGGWLLIYGAGSLFYPATVQRFSVQPNELERERQYIARNIEMTRYAFGLDKIEERPFPAAPEVSAQELRDNPETIQNVRLLDVRPLLQTYAQIQTIRPLYEFIDVDIDRYIVEGDRRQVMIAARELSAGRLPPDAQSWVNRRLQFTHGYGVVMSPVNEVVQEGLPQLWLKDIPVAGRLPVTRPEIYHGEEPDHYVIVNTKAKEFDYPVESGSVQTVFEGESGVGLGSMLRRLAFAWQFGDINIAISDSLTGDSRLLFRRNIAQRISTVAPFLTLDKDPYIVLAEGRLVWMQDAYTTTERFPYSRPSPEGFNYIRNSVKVVVNAYTGDLDFYIVDDKDPIIKVYSRIFPELFKPLSQMSAVLRDHLRYPEDLFLAQVNQYRTYHITDPDVLYNKEDIWSIPTELYLGSEAQLAPYYVTMRLPGEQDEEFALILPLTPARRQNTIAWVAARSDGADYGSLLAFRFPTDTLVFGPRQVESRIDQDTQISAQFSLWNQSGSRVIRGNLLMIPIGAGNLFVEPIYLQSETSQLPELKRVVVVNGNRIAMETTLERSLEVIFGQASASLPAATATPGGSPTPQGTRTPTPSPGPGTLTPTPTAAGGTVLPASISQLAREADAAYLRAQDALRRGDFAAYGVEIARVEALIKRIVELSGSQ